MCYGWFTISSFCAYNLLFLLKCRFDAEIELIPTVWLMQLQCYFLTGLSSIYICNRLFYSWRNHWATEWSWCRILGPEWSSRRPRRNAPSQQNAGGSWKYRRLGRTVTPNSKTRNVQLRRWNVFVGKPTTRWAAFDQA